MVKVIVPATTANLGSGFDCIGAALTLYNQFELTPGSAFRLTLHGEGHDQLSTGTDNLVCQAIARFYDAIAQPVPPLDITVRMGIPLARGLGSSATAIVGGLVGANAIAGQPLSSTALMQLAIAMEGHPDNVVPALLGGCHLAVTTTQGWQTVPAPWHPDIIPVVAIPDFTLSTAAARAALPEQYSRADTIFNIAHFGLLLRALETGKGDWLTPALTDRIHQPYRQRLIAGYEAVQQAAIASGAYGLVISGAGPALLALTATAQANTVAAALRQTWQDAGIRATVKILAVDTIGARIQPER